MMYSKLGHTFFFNNTDIFVESDTRKITDALVVKILNAYQNKTNSFFNIDSDVINYFKPRIQYATYDLKETENGFKYHHKEIAEQKNKEFNIMMYDALHNDIYFH